MRIVSRFGDYEVWQLKAIEELGPALARHNFKGALVDDYIFEKYLTASQLIPTDNIYRVVPNESAKQYGATEDVLDWMCQSRFERKTELLAIGGGTVQDIATYVSAVFHRGIQWTFVPTTLLAQADSCIGGKCGLNVKTYKNQVGLIHPPRNIYSVNGFLQTLSRADLISGMGEIIKIALTGERSFWDRYQTLVSGKQVEDLQFDELVPLALEAKRLVIETDEMEVDYRRVLNYGHTIGHAIEAASEFTIPHGIAVLLGIKAISRLGELWSITPSELSKDIQSQCDWLLRQSQVLHNFGVEEAITMIRHDKKTHDNQATFVILQKVGVHQFVTKNLDTKLYDDLASALHDISV
jgi:3-dehydroquinate synthase